MRNLTIAELGLVSGGQGGTSISVAQQNYSATNGSITQENFAIIDGGSNTLIGSSGIKPDPLRRLHKIHTGWGARYPVP